MITELLKMIPEGERIARFYRAFEGDIRIVTRDKRGEERRYTVKVCNDHVERLEAMS